MASSSSLSSSSSSSSSSPPPPSTDAAAAAAVVPLDDGLLAKCLLAYVDASPTPFHAVKNACDRLDAAGFTKIREDTVWRGTLEPGGRYYYTRNGSTLVAFCVGGQFKAGNPFKVIGAHTDSPVLKVKPVSDRKAHGYIQLGVETYGGGLWHTWFDRELTLAGRVIVATTAASTTASTTATAAAGTRLVHIKRPLLRVPNLCIHLQTADERKKFAPNKETHLQPIMATATAAKTKSPPSAAAAASSSSSLSSSTNSSSSSSAAAAAAAAAVIAKATEETLLHALDDRHEAKLLRALAQELGCEPGAIRDLELTLCDVQPGAVWGLDKEFLSAPRLDNQAHCFTGLEALVRASSDAEKLLADTSTAVLVLYDHEEVGSQSAQGAASLLFRDCVARITGSFTPQGETDAGAELMKVALRKSFFVSADVAHAVHPNYACKHESKHGPLLGQGTVIKTNDNQRYATDAVSGYFFREAARRAGAPVQEFVVRNDCPCGTTIGPIIAANTGIRTVDVGMASLSMHSIRETLGVADLAYNIGTFAAFYAQYDDILAGFEGF